MICEKCKTHVADTAKFCPKCGNKVESAVNANGDMKKCPQCGSENPASAKFCKVDGYNFQKTEEDKVIEKPVESEKPKDKILCPKCGTSYDMGAKFCKKDGENLQQGVSEPAQNAASLAQQVEPPQQPITPKPSTPKSSAEPSETVVEEIKQAAPPRNAVSEKIEQATVPVERLEKVVRTSPAREQRRKSSKGLLVAIILVLLVMAGVGSYLYFFGFLGKNPAKVGEQITEELKEKGLSVSCEIDKNWTATLKGNIGNAADKDVATGIVNAHKEVKELKYDIQKTGQTRTPRSDTRPRVDLTREEGNRQTMQPPPQADRPDPAKTEGELNRALRNVGLSGITAEVGDDMTVTLKGSTSSADDKKRAFDIARSFNGIEKMRDKIFVVR